MKITSSRGRIERADLFFSSLLDHDGLLPPSEEMESVIMDQRRDENPHL